jgi:hypothetical protein
MQPDRRDPVKRAAFVHSIVSEVVQSPLMEFTVPTVQQVLNVTPEIADRILHRLADAGLFQQRRGGTWVRVIPRRPFTAQLL